MQKDGQPAQSLGEGRRGGQIRAKKDGDASLKAFACDAVLTLYRSLASGRDVWLFSFVWLCDPLQSMFLSRTFLGHSVPSYHLVLANFAAFVPSLTVLPFFFPLMITLLISPFLRPGATPSASLDRGLTIPIDCVQDRARELWGSYCILAYARDACEKADS